MVKGGTPETTGGDISSVFKQQYSRGLPNKACIIATREKGLAAKTSSGSALTLACKFLTSLPCCSANVFKSASVKKLATP